MQSIIAQEEAEMEEFDEEELMGYLDAEEIFINSSWAWVPDDDDTPMSVEVTQLAMTSEYIAE